MLKFFTRNIFFKKHLKDVEKCLHHVSMALDNF
jgi:hypothetical protein